MYGIGDSVCHRQGKEQREMITFCIDELTPCLKDVVTGDILDTEVVALKRKSFLSKFNKKTGWYVNWGENATRY